MNIKELINVSKPARYIGGELNSIIKSDNDLLNFCLIFPDIYEIGSSHVGYKLLYERVNKSDKVYCQRFFAPWKDVLDYFGKDIFRSLEKSKPLDEFDVLGFSIQILPLAPMPTVSPFLGTVPPTKPSAVTEKMLRLRGI